VKAREKIDGWWAGKDLVGNMSAEPLIRENLHEPETDLREQPSAGLIEPTFGV
jgi:hypothetical protein